MEEPDFFQLQHLHLVGDRDEVTESKKDGKIRGWFFKSPIRAPYDREYKYRKGTQTRRTFIGWV